MESPRHCVYAGEATDATIQMHFLRASRESLRVLNASGTSRELFGDARTWQHGHHRDASSAIAETHNRGASGHDTGEARLLIAPLVQQHHGFGVPYQVRQEELPGDAIEALDHMEPVAIFRIDGEPRAATACVTDQHVVSERDDLGERQIPEPAHRINEEPASSTGGERAPVPDQGWGSASQREPEQHPERRDRQHDPQRFSLAGSSNA